MNLTVRTPVRVAIALSVSLGFAYGCSSSSDVTSATGNEIAGLDETNNTVTGSMVTSADELDDGLMQNPGETTTPDAGSVPTTDNGDQTTQDTIDQNPVVSDPLAPVATRINFDIEVPAYQSDALQVRLTWGDKELTAGWVGDEYWSTSDDFPSDTEQLLTATFSDANGEITIGSFEQAFRTGTNTSQDVAITAEQFDTSAWDDDGDGTSNLDELIAGTFTSGAPRILLFSETQGYRHESIADALTALEELANSVGIKTDFAADSTGLFTTTNLANYDAVAWVLTSGDVLNAEEQSAFEQYIRSGGGNAGIHAASDTEYDWPWYGSLVGAYFNSHPVIQTATQSVEDASHSSTRHLNDTWTRTDEWYNYNTNPRAQVNVLLSLDEDSYSGGTMGDDHPSAWYHDYDGGRSWYTGGGHTLESYAETAFLTHLLGGLRYAAGLDL